jgi:GT2 family glycosyltransferase
VSILRKAIAIPAYELVNGQSSSENMIHYFSPFSTTKEIGRVYNAHCAMVPKAEDWICIMDYDAMILCPETFKVIEAAIARYPDTALFGAMCNRIAYMQQRIKDEMDPNPNINDHISQAKWRAARYADGECTDANPRTLAGFFLLFRKSYWEYSRFQPFIQDERGVLFDHNFCLHAKREGLPMRIILGAYLFHAYRIDKPDHRDASHLGKTFIKK